MQMLDKCRTPKAYKFIKKPWGGFLTLEKYPNYWLKKLFINRDEQISLQSHKHRYEIWIVLQGKIIVQKGDVQQTLHSGEFIKIEKEEKHRISSLSNACVLEAAFGQPRERDIIRYEDKYDRTE